MISKKKTKIDLSINKLKTENKDLKQRLAHALADYRNLEARLDKQLRQSLIQSQINIIKDLLSLYESVERLYQHDNSPEHKAVLSAFDNFLNKYKIVKLEVKEGEIFNPETSQCLAVQPGPKDKVLEVVRHGFKLSEMIIQPALVKVGNGEAKENTKFTPKEVKDE